ncbi:MAG: hypothetical protein P1U62_04425, partial [Alteraurantiacibacter sp. bin_em_oilr2.035]|nr:hypothetical protein [Alteraurantiacibacter sp. bin_em_oilr2.035]
MNIRISTSLAAIAAVLVCPPLSTVALAKSAPVAAQQADQDPETSPNPVQSEDDINEIVVYGARLIGRVDAPQPPILELDQEDIAAYGAGSIAELIEALGPQVSSGRGRGSSGQPVILVNGVRIGSFRELRSYPPEAIERTEIYSEEVAQSFGYSPDQRVVNIILKDKYSSRELELEYGQPFDGGYSTQQVEGTYLRIDGPSRLNVNVEWDNSSSLTEGERGVEQSIGSHPIIATDPDPANFRSLVSDSAGVEATVNWNTALGDSGNQLSLNGTYERNDSLSLQGLDSVVLEDPSGNTALRSFNPADPLAVDRRTNSYSIGSTFNAGFEGWQVTGTLDGTYSDTRSRTQLSLDTTALMDAALAGDLALDADLGEFAEAGFDETQSESWSLSALATARGSVIELPAGDVQMTLDAGYDWNAIESIDTRNPGVLTDLSRNQFSTGVNVSIPITSRDYEFGGAIGDVTLNLNGGIDELSDFGTLFDWSAGLTWSVFDGITLSATYIARDSAPTLSQLGSPEIVTPNVATFDIANNETVLATVITGGNPDLPAQSQNDWKLGLNWELPFIDRGSFQIEYFNNHSENVTDGFPVLTSAIEAAFPDRIERDTNGQLTQLDQRFVTFAEQDVERLRFGLNLNGQFGGGEEATGGRQGRGGGDAASAGRQGGDQSGRPAGARDPERLAAMRAQFCESEPDALLAQFNAALRAEANGEAAPTGPDGEPLSIPGRMLQRLTGEDGQIDPERFATMRERICSSDPAQLARGPGERAPGAGAQARGDRQGGGGQRGGGGRGLARLSGGSDGPPTGRWFLNVQYELELENSVLIAPGIDRLDLLEGDALSGGGQPRHSINWRSGVFYDGYGLLLFARYTGESN